MHGDKILNLKGSFNLSSNVEFLNVRCCAFRFHCCMGRGGLVLEGRSYRYE